MESFGDRILKLNNVLAVKKRCFKRLVRKVIITAIIIVSFSLVTMIIKKHQGKETFQMFPLPTPQGERKDWTDHEAIAADKLRSGLGEHGLPAKIEDADEEELKQQLIQFKGLNGLLSDKISVNRSVPDIRHEKCKTRQYLAKLPSVSVIFIFYNEHFKTLLRSIHSVVNRSPSELINQIVLVDDGSELVSLKQQLDDYVSLHWPHLVHVVRNPKRIGLIRARLAGAKVATAEVMVFFDSHIEVSYNWLPPLLEPIVINKKISTCPIVDNIDYNTLEYIGELSGSRGGFDWDFYYKYLPLLPEDNVDTSLPYRSPVMMGGLFAINREFFWDLGGYDDELDIWGGEQYELSFKIWMCGGMLLDIPCSRVAHIFHNPNVVTTEARNYNYIKRNHKRVAEVWMDEYKKYAYERDPNTYNNIDAGDLTRQHAVRERLQCKSFDWYMKEVAPDFLEKFPPVEPPSYASGAIQSLGYPQYCMDAMNLPGVRPVGLYICNKNLTFPQANQFWVLSGSRDLQLRGDERCLEFHNSTPNDTVWMWYCHRRGGNQIWYYDRQHQWIVHGLKRNHCMEAFIENNVTTVYVKECQENNNRQRWSFGVINKELLDRFFDNI